MTNKEKYKQAFSALQPSNEIRLEEKIMKEYKRKQSKRIIVMAAILCLAVFAGGGGAYAANVGGIQRTIQLWIHGDQTTAELNVNDDGTYTVKIPDENGGTKTQSGGGVAFDAFGNERALTEEEILDHLDNPNIEYYDDGSIWLFYRDMAKDITNDFDDDGMCYVKISDDDGELYVTAKKYGGWHISSDKFASTWEFNNDDCDPAGVAYQPASEKPDAESGE